MMLIVLKFKGSHLIKIWKPGKLVNKETGNLENGNQRPNLKNLSGGLNLSRGLNTVGST